MSFFETAKEKEKKCWEILRENFPNLRERKNGFLNVRLDINVHDDVTLTAKKTLRVNLFIIHEHTFAKLNI